MSKDYWSLLPVRTVGATNGSVTTTVNTGGGQVFFDKADANLPDNPNSDVPEPRTVNTVAIAIVAART